MKKVLIAVLVIVLVWAAMFCVDFYRCAHLRKPIFVVAAETADDGGSGTYLGLGYRVEVEGTLSAEAGFVVRSVEMRMFGRVVAASMGC